MNLCYFIKHTVKMHTNLHNTKLLGLPHLKISSNKAKQLCDLLCVCLYVYSLRVCLCICVVGVGGGGLLFIKQLSIMLTICNVMQSISVGLLE